MNGADGPHRLAVYGTLVPGGTNAHVLDDVPGEWARGIVAGTRYEDGWHGYPGLVLGEEADPSDSARDGRVPVHVLRSPQLPAHLERLDAFEGPGYRRVVAQVSLAAGDTVDAWVYTLADPPR